MIKELNIENITVNLEAEGLNVRVRSDSENVLLINQRIDNVAELIGNNFERVKAHYEKLAGKAGNLPDMKDVYCLSLSIVLYYLYLYNSWRTLYKKEENRHLNFDDKDFESPSTQDIIFHYFKLKYPKDWKLISAVLLDVGLDELEAYYRSRERYYNK